MSHESSKIKWIETGYELFAIDGPEGIQVERLARILMLNKSGFYHYFGTREIYFMDLLAHFNSIVGDYDIGISKLKSFDEYIKFMVENKMNILFYFQLGRNRNIKSFNETYEYVNQKLEPHILPLWAKYVNLEIDLGLARRYYEIVRDMINIRSNYKNMTFEFINDQIKESQIVCLRIQSK
jgi:AcrR family transcriptional regulator